MPSRGSRPKSPRTAITRHRKPGLEEGAPPSPHLDDPDNSGYSWRPPLDVPNRGGSGSGTPKPRSTAHAARDLETLSKRFKETAERLAAKRGRLERLSGDPLHDIGVDLAVMLRQYDDLVGALNASIGTKQTLLVELDEKAEKLLAPIRQHKQVLDSQRARLRDDVARLRVELDALNREYDAAAERRRKFEAEIGSARRAFEAEIGELRRKAEDEARLVKRQAEEAAEALLAEIAEEREVVRDAARMRLRVAARAMAEVEAELTSVVQGMRSDRSWVRISVSRDDERAIDRQIVALERLRHELSSDTRDE